MSERITKQQSTSPMKNYPYITASLLVGSLVISSCSSNKMASSGADDNLYFMASDVKMATEYAVDNNTPESFKNIAEQPALIEGSFSSRNVNPEYISRYQASENATASEDGVVYFDESEGDQFTTGNINAYDNYTASNSGSGSGNYSPNVNFNFGLGFGYNPFAWGMSPYMGMNYGMGFMPGLSIGLSYGFGYPMYPGYGWGYPMFPSYGYRYPMYGYGYPMYHPFPVYAGYPSYVLPGGEYGDRRIVSGARPTRGSAITNTGVRSREAGVMPSTARAQARNSANIGNASARRTVSSANNRVATRDFSNSQNDYYNSNRGRVTTNRNTNSPAADRTVSTRSRTSIPSARPAVTNRGGDVRNYATPSRNSNPSYNTRSTSPSYNRGSAPAYNNRSSSPSYNRSTSPSNSNTIRTVAPSRSNSTFNAPSRTNSGGGNFSAPSRSSGGSSGVSTGGSRGGRGN